MKRHPAFAAFLALVAGLLNAGCTRPPIDIHSPTTARPIQRPQPMMATDGAIFRPVAYRPLFEDQRARHVGDTLTVVLNEKLNASRSTSSGANRSADMKASVPLVRGVPGKSFQGLGLEASSDSKFDGKGETAGSNLFTGTITVTVVDVLANGNLLVSGEKQIGINQSAEYVRFSGVVSPTVITPANTVSSTQVADARIDYQGRGYLDEAQNMGFLQRFFMSVMPY